eukprot:SAG11_NODE_2355_length_3475_cov_2.804799_2_plen_125_part_00
MMLEGFLKPLTKEEAQFMGDASRLSGSDLLPGMDRNKLEDALLKAFQAADAGSAGALPLAGVAAAIGAAGLGLSEKQIQALSTAGVEGDGGIAAVDYYKIIDVAWDLLVLVAREAYVSEKLATI